MTTKEQYIKLCNQHAEVPIFLQPWWLDVACEQWDAAIVLNGDEPAGIWPYETEQKIGVSIIRTPTLTPYFGPYIFYPQDLKETKKDAYEFDTIQALLKQIPDAHVWHLAIDPKIKQVALFSNNEFEVGAKQTYLLDLSVDEGILLSNLHESHRRKIKKKQDDIEIVQDVEGKALHQLWTNQEATLKSKNKEIHFSFELMQRLYKACLSHGCGTLWVAKQSGVVNAVIWQVWDNNNSYYLVGGKAIDIKDNTSMTLLLWQAILHAKNLGIKSFDFEGSMDVGVERFFKNFGAKKELYLTLRKNNSILWKLKETFL